MERYERKCKYEEVGMDRVRDARSKLDQAITIVEELVNYGQDYEVWQSAQYSYKALKNALKQLNSVS